MAAKYNYSLIRGDTNVLSVRVKTGNPFTAGDAVQLMVRESYDSEAVISKSVTEFDGNGKAFFVFTNEDTQSLTPGDYVYDIQVVRASGNVTTLIEKSRFRIREDVTYG